MANVVDAANAEVIDVVGLYLSVADAVTQLTTGTLTRPVGGFRQAATATAPRKKKKSFWSWLF